MGLNVCIDKRDRDVITDTLRQRYLHLSEVSEGTFKSSDVKEAVLADMIEVGRVLNCIEKLPEC